MLSSTEWPLCSCCPLDMRIREFSRILWYCTSLGIKERPNRLTCENFSGVAFETFMYDTVGKQGEISIDPTLLLVDSRLSLLAIIFWFPIRTDFWRLFILRHTVVDSFPVAHFGHKSPSITGTNNIDAYGTGTSSQPGLLYRMDNAAADLCIHPSSALPRAAKAGCGTDWPRKSPSAVLIKHSTPCY